jgi:hypothetical protein
MVQFVLKIINLRIIIHVEKSYFLNHTHFFVATSVFRKIRRKGYIQEFSLRIVLSFECQILNSAILKAYVFAIAE